MTNFLSHVNISTNIKSGDSVNNSTSKQVLIIAQRITGGVLYQSSNGLDQPNLYQPWVISPTSQNGSGVATFLQNYGLKFQLGQTNTLTLNAPSSVSSLNGNTLLSWNVIPNAKFNSIIGNISSATISQGSVNGILNTAYVSDGIYYILISGSVAFTTTATMTLVGNLNLANPDPDNTDPIVLMAWYFYQTALDSASYSNQPNAILSIISDRDTTISPNATPFKLNAPNTITVNDDDSVTITYTYTQLTDLDNFGYLPTTSLGESIVTQTQDEETTASGTYGGFTLSPTSSGGGTASVTLTNVTGTFNTTDELYIALDATQDVGQYLNGVDLHSAVLQFPITTANDLNVTQASFKALINQLNQANQCLNSHYGTYGIFGNTTTNTYQTSSLPSFDSNEFIYVVYPYYPLFGDITLDNTSKNVAAGVVSSVIAYRLANQEAPYPNITQSTFSYLPITSNKNPYYFYENGSSSTDPTNLAVQRGAFPIAVSGTIAVAAQSNTTLIYDSPGVSDTSYRYTHIWDCVRVIKYSITQLYLSQINLPDNTGQALGSQAFVKAFFSGVVLTLQSLETLGIVQNVSNNISGISVSVVSNELKVVIPADIIPVLLGMTATIDIFSTNYTYTAS